MITLNSWQIIGFGLAAGVVASIAKIASGSELVGAVVGFVGVAGFWLWLEKQKREK